MKYDAIVAGLGPAGATAAYELSKKGFNVLALDKQEHPRYKPCGGGLTAKIEKILDADFKTVVERTIIWQFFPQNSGRSVTSIAFSEATNTAEIRTIRTIVNCSRCAKTQSLIIAISDVFSFEIST